MITEKKRLSLQIRMEELGIKESDLEEKFILGSGRGGQKLQKTQSCVYLKHLPTGLEVKCGKERSRDLNRYYARKILCDQFEEKFFPERSKKLLLSNKIRKQKKRRARRATKEMD